MLSPFRYMTIADPHEPSPACYVERRMRPHPRMNDPVLARAIDGDPLALRALIQRHGPLVWSICRRLGAEPEDAYQAVWEKALKALPRFDPDGPAQLSTWLASIAHRHLVDEHRRRRVRGELVGVDELPAPVVSDRVDLGRLDAAVQELPDPLRRVVVLHHLHGVPLEELAATEAVPVGTVKSRLHRARAQLAATLGGGR